MKTAIDIGIALTAIQWSNNHKPFDSSKAYTAAISVELRRQGIPHSPAQYDEAGNCLTCGECGRCPGVHTFEEIQQAARKERVTA